MSYINAVLNGAVIQVINANDSTVRVNSAAGNPTLSCNTAFYNDFALIASGAGTVIDVPGSGGGQAWVVYIRNLGGVSGSPAGNITVQFQVVSGSPIAQIDSPIVVPGGIFMYWNPAETAGGIAAVTLIASTAGTPVEILLAT